MFPYCSQSQPQFPFLYGKKPSDVLKFSTLQESTQPSFVLVTVLHIQILSIEDDGFGDYGTQHLHPRLLPQPNNSIPSPPFFLFPFIPYRQRYLIPQPQFGNSVLLPFELRVFLTCVFQAQRASCTKVFSMVTKWPSRNRFYPHPMILIGSTKNCNCSGFPLLFLCQDSFSVGTLN